MAINRIRQVTAETRSPTEWISTISTGGPSNFPTVSSVKARTGTYSWLTGRAIGIALPLVNCVRSHYALNHMGGDGQLLLWRLHSLGEVTSSVTVYYDQTTNEVILTVGDVTVATASASAVGLTQTDTWISIGLYAEAGTPGKVVLYMEGLEVLRYDGTVLGTWDYILSTGGFPTGLIPDLWTTGYLDDWYVDELTDGNVDEGSPPSYGFMSSLVENEFSVMWQPIGDTPNVACVDDGVPDNDTTYVKAEEPDLDDIYSVSSITLPEDYFIIAAIPYAIARKTDAESGMQLSLLAYDGANTLATTAQNLPTGYRVVYGRMPLQPDSAVWNENDYNDMLFGFRSAGTF